MGNGVCTLRAAVMEANRASGAQVLLRSALGPYALTTPPLGANGDESGDLDLVTDMTVEGEGEGEVIVDGGLLDRVFSVHATVGFSRITVRGGRVVGTGGGIAVLGHATLTDCVVRENAAEGSTGGFGGGIFVADDASLRVERSTIAYNRADDAGGGIAIGRSCSDPLPGVATVVNSTVSDNGLGFGGVAAGIWNCGTLSLRNATVASNHGEGIGNAYGSVLLANSVIALNRPQDCIGVH